jgi:hypothetical protein
VVKQSSPCTLFTASSNVLQSSGTRTESAVVVVDGGDDNDEAGTDVFVSPASTDTDCTVIQH